MAAKAVSILLAGIFCVARANPPAWAHHHTYSTIVPDCLGTSCTTFSPVCVIETRRDGNHIGVCQNVNHCGNHNHPTCTAVNLNTYSGSCCCSDQACVEHVKVVLGHPATGGHQTATTAAPSTLNHVACSTCSDVKNNICAFSTTICSVNEVCKIVETSSGVITQCEEKNKCESEKLQSVSTVNNTHTTSCCSTSDCFHNLVQLLTTGHTNALQCQKCTDGFTGICEGDTVCASTEVCMLNVNSNGQLETGCMDSAQCTASKNSNPEMHCCVDRDCTATTLLSLHKESHYCPFCLDETDPMGCLNFPVKCSHTSTGCYIYHAQTGYSSGCETDLSSCQREELNLSPLCFINPIPFNYKPDLVCKFCCNENDTACMQKAFENTAIPTYVPPTTASPVVGVSTTQSSVSGITSGSTITTTPSSTTATGTTNGSVCIDQEDVNFSCKEYDNLYGICSHTSGFAANIAYIRCPKTCGHCGQTPPPYFDPYATTPVPATTAVAPTGTTSPCIDHDPKNNCKNLASTLCYDTSPHIRNFAITNCAKTCNLCAEYLNMLASLQQSTG